MHVAKGNPTYQTTNWSVFECHSLFQDFSVSRIRKPSLHIQLYNSPTILQQTRKKKSPIHTFEFSHLQGIWVRLRGSLDPKFYSLGEVFKLRDIYEVSDVDLGESFRRISLDYWVVAERKRKLDAESSKLIYEFSSLYDRNRSRQLHKLLYFSLKSNRLLMNYYFFTCLALSFQANIVAPSTLSPTFVLASLLIHLEIRQTMLGFFFLDKPFGCFE